MSSIQAHSTASILKVQFLGTGTSTGVPFIGCNCPVCTSTNPKDKRLRSSIAISDGTTQIVIDTGPDFRQQMLAANITKLDAILYTHSHSDHVAGLDDIRPYNIWQKKPLPIYATQQIYEHLKAQFAYIFEAEPYPGAPSVDFHPITFDKAFNVNTFKEIIPIQVIHGNNPIMGFRLHNFAYITDASKIYPKEMDKLKQLDTLVINALRYKEHWSHFNLAQAQAVIAELQPKRAYLTHISHQMGLHNEVAATLPTNIQLAYDQLEITVPIA